MKRVSERLLQISKVRRPTCSTKTEFSSYTLLKKYKVNLLRRHMIVHSKNRATQNNPNRDYYMPTYPLYIQRIN
jgi:hypothetical protein